jgi:uncharacterized protein (DUF4415 family)
MKKRPDPELVDDENPELTKADFARARPARDVLPELFGAKVASEALKPRGRPKLAQIKQPISLRMDADVLAKWKATGTGWQTRMVEVLAKAAPRAR